MKTLSFLLLCPLFLFSQTQIHNNIDGHSPYDNSGYSVSISADGSVIAVGSPNLIDTDTGHVRVYRNSGTEWVQIGDPINGENVGDHFGTSISLSSDGTIIAIGGPENTESPEIAGHVRVYQNTNDVWTQIGTDIYGQAEAASSVRFGIFVSLSNDGTVLAVATNRTGNFDYIQIYQNIAGAWMPIGEVVDSGIPHINGVSLSGEGTMVAISGNFFECIFQCYGIGYAKVYKNLSNVWTQAGSTFEYYGDDSDFNFYISGVALADNGSKIVLGGNYLKAFDYLNDDWVNIGEIYFGTINSYYPNVSISANGMLFAANGYPFTRVYQYSSKGWAQIGEDIIYDIGSNGAANSLDLSKDGSFLVLGSPYVDGVGEDTGNARAYDLSALLSVNETEFNQFKMYPNPAHHQVTIQCNTGIRLKQINIYTHLGQMLHSTNDNTVNTSHFASGLYYAEVITNRGATIKKLVID